MSIQKKEYELSVWKERLGENGSKEEYKEYIIGAHDMDYLGRAINIKFTEKLNGTHTLTFQMPVNFFDSKKGEYIRNEFVDAIFNEKKVKLKYQNKWYEFFVKTVEDKKTNKSYLKTYTCTDSFIDELSRNGYGLVFDTDLYNNVEEVGTFMEEILEDSIWSYAPENNWGDFTEYTEEKMFKIPVSQFKNGIIKGYEINYQVENPFIETEEQGEITREKLEIIHPETGEKRPLEIGDDLSRDLFFWDQYKGDNLLLKEEKIIENDGYIYVFFSQLDFCYAQKERDKTYYEATEIPQIYEGKNTYALAPSSVDPTAFIQFMAFPGGTQLEIDETGLILNKNYHYLMTIDQWNNLLRQDSKSNFEGSNYFYQFSLPNKENEKHFLSKEEGLQASSLTGNWTIYYEGYLEEKNGIEIRGGKKISISDRTEINISENIDQYVKVYNNSPEEFKDMWVNPDGKWVDKEGIDYRICSVQKTQQVIPQIAKNLIANGSFIKSTDGWETMSTEGEESLKIKYGTDSEDSGGGYLIFQGVNKKGSSNTAINFGMVANDFQIEKGKTYCVGVEGGFSTEKEDKILIGKGSIIAQGKYEIKDEVELSLKTKDKGESDIEEIVISDDEKNKINKINEILNYLEYNIKDYFWEAKGIDSSKRDLLERIQNEFIEGLKKAQDKYLKMKPEDRVVNLTQQINDLEKEAKTIWDEIINLNTQISQIEQEYPGGIKKEEVSSDGDISWNDDIITIEYPENIVFMDLREASISITFSIASLQEKIEEIEEQVKTIYENKGYTSVSTTFSMDIYLDDRNVASLSHEEVKRGSTYTFDQNFLAYKPYSEENSFSLPFSITLWYTPHYTPPGSSPQTGISETLKIEDQKIENVTLDGEITAYQNSRLEDNENYKNKKREKEDKEEKHSEITTKIKNYREDISKINQIYENINSFNPNDKEIKNLLQNSFRDRINNIKFASKIEEFYYLIQFEKDIKNPYFALQFSDETSRKVKKVYFFEAYSKGQDQFELKKEEVFNYSGRPISKIEIGSLAEDLGEIFHKEDGYSWISLPKDFLRNFIMFEDDVLSGTSYSYSEYFIQQIQAKEEVKDTFQLKEYLMSERKDLLSKNLRNLSKRQLPYSRKDYTEEDLVLSTKYLDLSKCSYLTKKEGTYQHICSKTKEDCLYQKLGYCPFLLKTEKTCRRIRTLNEQKSNKLALTQKVGEKFEIYPIYSINHNANGKILTDKNGVAEKYIYFLTKNGNLNPYGFRYKENLKDITRVLKSDQIVTKLYVEDVDSKLSKTGLCSIKTAEDNISKDSFILDFSYYAKKNILNEEDINRDLYGSQKEDLGFLKKLGYLNKQYDLLSNAIINLQGNSFSELEANISVMYEGIISAQQQLIKLKEKMSRYSTKNTESQTYKNYIVQKEEQEGILNTLVIELLMEDNAPYLDRNFLEEIKEKPLTKKVASDLFLNKYSISSFKESKWVREQKYLTGMLGQYNKEFLRIKELKKKQSNLLYEINDLSLKFYQKYEPYIKEGVWSKKDCLTDNSYYQEALQVSAQNAIPKIEYTINVLDISPLKEEYIYHIGDQSYVEDEDIYGINLKTGLPNKMQVLISEITYDLDLQTNNVIKVQNYTTQFEDLFAQISSSVASLSLNEGIYKRASNFTPKQGLNEESLQNSLDENEVTFIKKPEDNLSLDSNGQTGKDINNHANQYKLNGQGLFFSNNGGQSWNTGVGPGGINADYIKVGTLDAGKVKIVDNDYLYFYWDKSGIVALKKPKEGGSMSFDDFCCYNKAGLSLVEGGRIRLRAGYSFAGTGGDFKSETKTGDEIGFYLYDRNGRVIFGTETETESQNSQQQTAGKSAQLILNGEICALIGGTEGTEDEVCAAFLGTKENSKIGNQRILSVIKKDKKDGSTVYKNFLTLRANGAIMIGGDLTFGENLPPENIKDLPENIDINEPKLTWGV